MWPQWVSDSLNLLEKLDHVSCNAYFWEVLIYSIDYAKSFQILSCTAGNPLEAESHWILLIKWILLVV